MLILALAGLAGALAAPLRLPIPPHLDRGLEGLPATARPIDRPRDPLEQRPPPQSPPGILHIPTSNPGGWQVELDEAEYHVQARSRAEARDTPRAAGPRPTPLRSYSNHAQYTWYYADGEHGDSHLHHREQRIWREARAPTTTSGLPSVATSKPPSSSSVPPPTSKPSTSAPSSSTSKPPPSLSSALPTSSSLSSSAKPTSTEDEPDTTTEPPSSTSKPPAASSSSSASSTDTSSTPSNTPSASSEPSDVPPSSSGVPIGAIIGGAIGGAVVVGGLVAVVFLRARKRHRRRDRDSMLLMDPDFPIALDPYYPVRGSGTHSPALSALARQTSVGSMDRMMDPPAPTRRPSVQHSHNQGAVGSYPTRRSGYEAYDDSVEYVYAGSDGYYDRGSAMSPSSTHHATLPSQGQHAGHSAHFAPSTYGGHAQRMPVRSPSQGEHQGEFDHYRPFADPRYQGTAELVGGAGGHEYDTHGYGQPQHAHGGYPSGGGGYPARGGYAQPQHYPQTQHPQQGHYPQYSGDAYPTHDGFTYAQSPQARASPPTALPPPPAALPPPPTAQAHVSPEMVVHEEDAGVVLPTTLPPMYRAEWAPAEGASGTGGDGRAKS